MKMEYRRTHDPKNAKNIFLYFTAVTIHLTSLTAGIAFCWSAPVSPKLESQFDNPLGYPLSIDEISWLASLISLGASVGPFIGGYLADLIGRKQTLIITTILTILTFIILAFGKHLYLYYAARFIGGICVGLFLTVVPMYIGEIAEVHNRGTLAGLLGVFIVTGNLYCFAIGPYLSIQWFSLSCMISAVIFLIICTTVIPETPCYLIMKGNHEEARRSLRKLRCGDIENELLDLSSTVKESLAASGGITDILTTNYLRRGLLITLGLMIIQQMTAISAVILYMQNIFENAGSSLSKEIATIIVGTVQVVSTFLSSVVVDKLGRRPLILISATVTSISLLALSIYFYLLITIDVTHISWLPLVALIVYIFFYNVGIGPLPFTVLSEIFPPHVKSTASSFSVACCFIISFGVAKFFPILADLVDNWFAFLFFGLCNTVGIFFIWYRLPETKGKTLAEILESLK